MKLQKLLLLSLLVASCTPPVKVVDGRPAGELSLIKKFHAADSLYRAEQNEIKQTEVYDKQYAELTKFITDSLNARISEWHAFVYEIKAETFPTDYIKVTLLVTPGKYFDQDQKYPELSNIILSTILPSKESIVKNTLKELLKGDKVLVSGAIEKSTTGTVDFTRVFNEKSNTFSNPELKFKLEKIIAIKTE